METWGLVAALVLGKSVIYYAFFRGVSDRLGMPRAARELWAALLRSLSGVAIAAGAIALMLCGGPIALIPATWLGRLGAWAGWSRWVTPELRQRPKAMTAVVAAGIALNLLIDLALLAAFGFGPTIGVFPRIG